MCVYSKLSSKAVKMLHFQDQTALKKQVQNALHAYKIQILSKNSFQIINAFISFIQEFFSDDYINDIEQEFDRVRWYEAEIFRIHNCRTLRLRLDDGRDSLSDYFRQKILIIEDIEELELQTFLVGKVPSSSSYGTVMINECLYTRVR